MRFLRLVPPPYRPVVSEAQRRCSMPMLSSLGRIVVLRELLLKRASSRHNPLSVPLKTGRLSFDGREKADWHTYDEIFIQQQYQGDFRGTVVIDVGAHRGMFSAYALLNGARAVLAYEPAQENFAYLRRTLESFRKTAPQLDLQPSAVASKAGTETFHIYDESWSHSTLVRENRTLVAKREVEMVAFESIAERAASMLAKGERLIAKIDAEGAEYDIILNTKPSAFSRIDELFAEIHGYATGDPNRILGYLRQCGFVGMPETLASGSYEFIHGTRPKR